VKKGKGFDFKPISKIERPWIVLGGQSDLACDIEGQRKFTSKVEGAKLVELPKVGHGFGVFKNWQPQFFEALAELSTQEKPVMINSLELQDLPLIEIRSPNSKSETLTIILSGDGGWASIDKEIAEALTTKDISVVGIDSLRYFWNEKKPEELAKDLETIINYYLKEWKLKSVLFIGYSMGADVLPFALSKISEDSMKKISGVAYLGLSKKAEFEVKVVNWLGAGPSESGLDILPELKKLSKLKSLCIRGEDEDDSGCDLDVSPLFQKKVFPGGHHFGGDFLTLSQAIIDYFKI
jgi:type IV secretory pathway VirJ component